MPNGTGGGEPTVGWDVHLPHLGRNVDSSVILAFARALEDLGVSSGWVSDHVCWPADIRSKYPYTDDGSFGPSPDMAWLDPLGTLLFVAAGTQTLRLGTTVLILPYRAPVATAKQIATLDVLSAGRVILGVGVGWMAEEAAVLGMPWDHRGRRADEQLELFQTLFTDTQPEFHGEFYDVPKVGFEPKPVQQPLPIWVGGSTEKAFARAARYGSGFHAAFQPLPVVTDSFRRVQAYADERGRDPGELTLSLRIFLDPAGAMESAKSISGSTSAMTDRVGELVDAGVSHVVLDPVARGGVNGRLDAVRAFMEDVASAFVA